MIVCSEHEILREEVRSLQEVRAKLQTRVQDLEEEIKRMKEEAEKGRKEKEEEDEEVPMAQRKRFTRSYY
jgi:mitogen-activated protein kinase 8 interacting protein 3